MLNKPTDKGILQIDHDFKGRTMRRKKIKLVVKQERRRLPLLTGIYTETFDDKSPFFNLVFDIRTMYKKACRVWQN